MKSKIIFLLLAIILASCQPVNSPPPEIQEATRIVEETLIVTKIVEVPKITKETVMVTELIEITPTKQPIYYGEFELKPEYFDAILALIKHFEYLDTKDCKAYYESFSQEGQKNSLEDTITYCEKAVGNVEVIYVYPFNYVLYLEGRPLGKEPENHVYLKAFVLWEEMSLGEMVERDLIFYDDMVLEDNVWKVNSTNSSPFFY